MACCFLALKRVDFRCLNWTCRPTAGRQLDPLVEAETEPWQLAGDRQESLFALRPYRGDMKLDIAQSQISQDPQFGTSGGIQLALSDVLGNEQYTFVLSHIAGSQTGFFDGLNIALSRYHLGQQLNWSWGLFRLNDRFSSTFGRFVREKRTGGFVGVSYPFLGTIAWNASVAALRQIDRQFEDADCRVGWPTTS